MTRNGAADLLPIRLYGDGGIVRTPQIYAAGERYQPEAIIPLKGGAVPVQLTGAGSPASGRGGGPINVVMVANMMGAPPGNVGVGFRQVFGQMANDAGARLVRQMARG
jgi:phage-related minor tail protein